MTGQRRKMMLNTFILVSALLYWVYGRAVDPPLCAGCAGGLDLPGWRGLGNTGL